MMRRKILKILTGWFTLLLLTACKNDNTDLRCYIESIKRQPPAKIDPLPDLTKTLPNTLSQENPQDPFRKPVRVVGNNQASRKEKQMLELFPLESLKFRGILKKGDTLWALIAEPSGRIVKVESGHYMGLNHGKIISIQHDVIQVEETIHYTKTWKKQIIALYLDKDEKNQNVPE